nr:hypothetical protein [Niveibacterium umoris]
MEAIVALTILATTGVALFSWIGTNLREAGRLKQVEREARWRLQAVEWLNGLNPAENPEGRVEFDGLMLRWTSKPAGDFIEGAALFDEGRSLYQLAPFSVSVDVSEREGDTPLKIDATLLGWRRVRDLTAPD